MLGNYLTMALRVLYRSPLYSAINIVGLSIGLAACILILLFVREEMSYDSWIANSDALFRIDTLEKYAGRAPLRIARAPGPLTAAAMADFDEIEDITRGYLTSADLTVGGQPYQEDILVADPNFLEVMTLPMRVGQADRALHNTNSVALSERMAEKFFGAAEAAMGQPITFLIPNEKDFVVSAVFATLPVNTHMAFDIVIAAGGFFPGHPEKAIESIPRQWGGAYFHTYARLKDGRRYKALESDLPAFIDRHLPAPLVEAIGSAPHEFFEFRLVPVEDIHFKGAPLGAMKPAGDIRAVYSFLAIAALILIIAVFNFTNMATARSSLRMREVALRKTLGARRGQVITQFLGEAVLLTLLALVIALALVEVGTPYFTSFLNQAIQWGSYDDPLFLGGILALTAMAGLGAGFYPAFVLSAIPPGNLLRSGGSASLGSGAFQSRLVVIQFAIAISLISATIILFQQSRFMGRADLGFNPDNLLIVTVPSDPEFSSVARTLADRLKSNPDVISVAVSSSVPAVPSESSEANLSITFPGAAKPIQVGFHTVGRNFFPTYGVTAIAGRLFSEAREADTLLTGAEAGERPRGRAILNESAVSRLGFQDAHAALGQELRTGTADLLIVGVVPDMHFRSLHHGVRDEIFIAKAEPGNTLSVRYRAGNVAGFLSFVDQTWRELVPNREIRRTFMDTAIEALYQAEGSRFSLLAAFSALAVLIASIGLFAMAAFTVKRRTREIGVRKVLGARTLDISRLLVWQFCKPVLLANLIAWPLMWWLMLEWLNGFAYRIELSPLPFLAAGAIAFFIAVATVATQAYGIARSSPVNALGTE